MKRGDWAAVAKGAADARDKMRSCYRVIVEIQNAEPTPNASYTWVPMHVLNEIQKQLAAAAEDLTRGLKGRAGRSRLRE
jgi:hypothetical protein